MAVKRKKQKRLESAASWAKAVKIKCCYCDAKETCKVRERKEKDENKGIMTWCTMTPNKKDKKKKKQASNAFTEQYSTTGANKKQQKGRK